MNTPHQQVHLDTLTNLWSERQALAEREYAAVLAARLERATWEAIADSLGVSRQSAHERFSVRLGIP